jgi:tetratricopeptide (TPR) repeat protein
MATPRHYIICVCFLALLSAGAAPAFDDSTAPGLVSHGLYLAEQGNHNAAIDKFDKAIARDANLADAYGWRAASLIAVERLDEAESSIQRALKLNDREFTHHMIAGRLDIARGRIDEGTAKYEKAAKLSPSNAGKVYADLAAAMADRKDDKLAPQIESALKSAASANPPHLDALFNLGQSYVTAGRQEGRDYLRRYIAGQQKLPEEQRDTQKIQLARKMIRAVDILEQIK